ncbi:MAG: sugar ABC transporter permease [Lachnospiraceae bacterium]|nr:sugar ABC transporter permease [Lachnospiraceae bacterium]
MNVTKTNGTTPKKVNPVMKSMRRNWPLYLFVLPMLVYIIIFNYWPMYGLQIAFKNYTFQGGFTGSPWVGFKWFEQFLTGPRFLPILKNTLRISIYSLIAGFPLPIVLALVLNGIENLKWKKLAQTITYMPHFISMSVLCGMLSLFLSPSTGIVNTALRFLGLTKDGIYFLGQANLFHHVYVWSGVWQGMGWGSIIYLAALSGVDPGLHEAAKIDGANKIQRVWHIDIPCILPTIVILLVMNCGSVLGVGYEKVYLLQNNLNMTTSEVISTYVYKMGLISRQYSFSTAVGLMNNVVNFIILAIVNKTSDKLSGISLW